MPHLVRRFFGFLRASPLTPVEQDRVSRALTQPLGSLFFRQRPEDQRHALEVASRVGDRSDLIEAALLHDVGKSASDLGAVGRSLATMWSVTGLGMPHRWRRYVDHGTVGAALLEDAGAGPLAVAFAHHHPGPPPPGIAPADWRALSDADDA